MDMRRFVIGGVDHEAASVREIAASDARNRFGELLDAARGAPVRVTRKGRAVAVMMSAQQYARLQGAA